MIFNGLMLYFKVIGSLVVDEMFIKGDIFFVDVNLVCLVVDFSGY